MNKIVLEHYPLEKLPEDIRAVAGRVGSVTLTIEREKPEPIAAADLVKQLREEKARMRPGEGRSLEDIVAEIRALRDEWDD